MNETALLSAFIDHLGPMFSVFLASFLQSITGFGLMITAAPLLMFFYDAKFTVCLLIYLGLLANSIQSLYLWRTAKHRLVIYLLMGAFLGEPLGYWLYRLITPNTLKITISVILLVFLLITQFAHVNFSQRPQNSFIAGIFSGFMATTVSMAGPALIIYFANTAMERRELRSTCVLYFACVQLSSFLIFSIGGTDMNAAGQEFIYLLPGLAAGLIFGNFAFKYISAKLFRAILFAMLYFICFQSLYTALIK